MDQGGIKVGALVERRDDDAGREACRDLRGAMCQLSSPRWDVEGLAGAVLKLRGANSRARQGRRAYPGIPREPHLHGPESSKLVTNERFSRPCLERLLVVEIEG